MRLSARGRYALEALLDLAANQGDGLVLLTNIARRQEVSLPYVEHLIPPFIAASLVKSTRGAGWRLTTLGLLIQSGRVSPQAPSTAIKG